MTDRDLERVIIETAAELKGIRAGVTRMEDGQKELWKAIDGLREVEQENRIAITELSSIKGTLTIHLTLILATIAGIVSLGLWWMRVGMGK
ncbi:hypothetical protein LCGC14_0485720 [marine sediment metagenome]|uniref:Uncharacterized protein n=1 Tax=marine sediment metagenome TaxID=412755 RepID=A0A0F9S7X8_9ZZZZ